MVYSEGTTSTTSNTGTIDVIAGTTYNVNFEILRNDLGHSSEYVTDVLIDGKSLGACHPDGGDYDCTFFSCPFGQVAITPASSQIDVDIQIRGHSWDCDCDKVTWECSKQETVAGRAPMSAVGRFTLTPTLAI